MDTFKFYKEEEKWFADLPSFPGSKEELQMVDGADTWLDKLSNNGQEVNLAISIEEPLTNKLELVDSDDFGATYLVKEHNGEPYDHKVWLCPVTVFVFNEYPETIWYETK